MGYWQPEQWVAGGTIGPSRFVKVSTAADHTVLQSTANDVSYGISQVGTKSPPGVSGSNDAIAAIAGDQIQIYTFGDVAQILGAETIARGSFVKPNATGQAVVCVANDSASGYLIESVSNNTLALCKVLPPGSRAPSA